MGKRFDKTQSFTIESDVPVPQVHFGPRVMRYPVLLEMKPGESVFFKELTAAKLRRYCTTAIRRLGKKSKFAVRSIPTGGCRAWRVE